MISPAERLIDGDKYIVMPLDAWSSFELFPSVAKMILPAIGGVMSTKGALNIEKLGELAAALSASIDSIPPKEIRAIAQQLLGPCLVEVNGRRVQLMPIADVHFQGKILTLMKVVKFALETNYADFWQGLQRVHAAAEAKRLSEEKSKSQTPTPTTTELQPSGTAGA